MEKDRALQSHLFAPTPSSSLTESSHIQETWPSMLNSFGLLTEREILKYLNATIERIND
jgi:hypothetical protein